MRVHLAYGEEGLDLEVPDHTTVVVPSHESAHPHPHGALLDALRQPIGIPSLRQLARPGQSVAISVCDITRAQPREAMLEAIFEELDGVIAEEDSTILIATGTHRTNTPEELGAMLGKAANRCRVVNHVARDRDSLVDLGRVGAGVPLFLNREWVEADLKITTGFVEPHFFAGFSGGPKMVAPGLAGLDTVLVLHDAKRVGHAKSTWGVIDDNPLHRDIRACAAHAGAKPDFSLDVLLNQEHRITRVFAGELFAMHRVACAAALEAAMHQVPAAFDVVLTTNSGYPLDQNLYQAVKGMSAAAKVVAPGGTIICAAECRDGLPEHGRYAETLRSGASIRDLLDEIESRPKAIADQWQVQVQALIQGKADVLVHAGGLDRSQIEEAHFQAAPDLEAAVRESLEKAGPNGTLCVLPEGPQTIPFL